MIKDLNRIGIVKISSEFIQNQTAEQLSMIFKEAGFFVYDIKWSPSFLPGDGLAVYMGRSRFFDEIKEGDEIAEYEFEIRNIKKNQFKVKVKRCS